VRAARCARRGKGVALAPPVPSTPQPAAGASHLHRRRARLGLVRARLHLGHALNQKALRLAHRRQPRLRARELGLGPRARGLGLAAAAPQLGCLRLERRAARRQRLRAGRPRRRPHVGAAALAGWTPEQQGTALPRRGRRAVHPRPQALGGAVAVRF
jgi:hypothetical protein